MISFFVKHRLDDIQDNSILRRGIPVAHSIYGVASTINAANYVMFIALERVKSLDNPEVRNLKKNIFKSGREVFLFSTFLSSIVVLGLQSLYGTTFRTS